jgi:inosine/xanthosine triphosphatase
MNEEAFRPAPSLSRALAGEAIRVGTQNPAKLGAVQDALRPFVRDGAKLMLVPVGVESAVAEQPIGWDEIVLGARNRARAAFESGDCVLAVGIEDGLVRLADSAESDSPGPGPGSDAIYNVGCAWLTDGEREGHGFSSGFAYPPGCLERAIRDQAPIGDLFDELWRAHRAGFSGPAKAAASGRQGGNIGMLTQGRLDRSAYGAQAVICALVRFLHTDLYD